MIPGMVMMSLADAEQIEASVTEVEAPGWLKMVAWAAEPAGRRSCVADDPAVLALSDRRRREFLAAICRMVEFADRRPSERIPVMG